MNDPAALTTHQLTSLGTPLRLTAGGTGRAVLVLHGGGGLPTVLGLATQLAREAHVLAPTHPGWDGTTRPDAIGSLADVAALYTQLLQERHLNDVVVIGSSLGGWIGAELAAHDHDGRIAHLVLIDAVGIDVPGEPITDFFALDARGVAAHSFHDSERFFTDPATLPAAELARMGGNRATMQALAGDPYMHDPTLRSRLSDVLTPTTVIWGESDRIATPAYGRAYAESFGTQAQVVLIPEAGHLPHIEQPAATRAVIDALVAQPTRHASAGRPGLTRRGSEVGDRPVA